MVTRANDTDEAPISRVDDTQSQIEADKARALTEIKERQQQEQIERDIAAGVAAARETSRVHLARIEEQAPTEPDEPGGQVATVDGEKVYIKGSTMREIGFHTEDEYIHAQSLTGGLPGSPSPLGPHPINRARVDFPTVVLTDYAGKPVARVRQEVFEGGGLPGDYYEKELYRVPVVNYRGSELLLPPNEARLAESLQGEAKFEKYRQLGLIPTDATYKEVNRAGELVYTVPVKEPVKSEFERLPQVYDSGRDEFVTVSWEDFRKREQYYEAQKSREGALGLLAGYIVDGGYNLSQALYDGVPREVLQSVGWDESVIESSQKQADAMKLLEAEPGVKIGDRWRLAPILSQWQERSDLVEAAQMLFKPEDIEKTLRIFPYDPRIQSAEDRLREIEAEGRDPDPSFIDRVKGEIEKLGERFNIHPGIITSAIALTPVAVGEPTPAGEIAILALLAAGAVIGGMTAGRSIGERISVREGVTPTVEKEREIPPQMAPQITEIPSAQLAPTVTEVEAAPLAPVAVTAPTIQLAPSIERIDLPQMAPIATEPQSLILRATEVAEAETDLGNIIRPKIYTIEEWDKFLPAIVKETSTALVRLDEAVQDAFTRGVITEEEVTRYHAARMNYLTKKDLLNTAMRSYLGGMQPDIEEWRPIVPMTIQQAITTIQQSATSTAIQTINTIDVETLAVPQIITMVENATQTTVQQAIENITSPAIRTAVQTQTQTIVSNAVQTAVANAVATGVLSSTAAMTATAALTTTIPRIPPPPPPPPPPFPPLSRVGYGKRKQIPDGAITWKQGWCWKYISPPYNQLKPTSLGSNPPIGAINTELRTPRETLQIIGIASSVPNQIAIDLGWADIFINQGKYIDFSGGGTRTDVGSRIPSTTKGMSIEGGISEIKGGELMDEEEREELVKEPVEYEPVVETAPELIEESPTREANGDDLSNLFQVPRKEDLDMRTDDLISVDLEKDVMDGDLSDLTEVRDEDIMGDRPKKKVVSRRIRRVRRTYQPAQFGGTNY